MESGVSGGPLFYSPVLLIFLLSFFASSSPDCDIDCLSRGISLKAEALEFSQRHLQWIDLPRIAPLIWRIADP